MALATSSEGTPGFDDEGGSASIFAPAARDSNQVPALRPGEEAIERVGARWWQAYSWRVRIGDLAAVTTAILVAAAVDWARGNPSAHGQFNVAYSVLTALLAILWLTAISSGRTTDRRIVGHGNTEYQRVVSVSWRLFSGIGLASFLLEVNTTRLYLAVAFLAGTVLLLFNRWAWRKWLHAHRRRNELTSRVLIVGTPLKGRVLARELTRSPHAGFDIVGLCVPTLQANQEASDHLPVLGDFAEVGRIAKDQSVDLVAVSGADSITADAVRQLSWDLEGSGIDISVSIGLVDVAGPRFLLHPAGNLPLVYVDEPEFTGVKFFLKSVVDFALAAAMIVMLSPVLMISAIAVWRSGPGPIIYRQTRVGLNGKAFEVFKFRSMHVGADSMLEEVMANGITLFYKSVDDPRVTRAGRVLRRFSLDELPQLFNVLRGEMSLVGPRPQIEQEVALYDRKAHRRLLVKPGMTGLWQVSGRSRLSVDDAIRLDVYYVENWTIFGDVLIMLRTLKAVVGADGAY